LGPERARRFVVGSVVGEDVVCAFVHLLYVPIDTLYVGRKRDDHKDAQQLHINY
jgi:hypothetical protein